MNSQHLPKIYLPNNFLGQTSSSDWQPFSWTVLIPQHYGRRIWYSWSWKTAFVSLEYIDPLSLVLLLGTTKTCLDSSFNTLKPPLCLVRSMLSLLLLMLNSPSAFSFSVYDRFSNPIIIFIVLYCTCLSLYWGAQNWTQDWTERKKCLAWPAGNIFPDSAPNAEYSLRCKGTTWCPPRCSESSLKICCMPGQPPAHPAPCSSSIWGAGFGISLCWTSRVCCQAISAVCWGPPEWQHTHLVVSQLLFLFCIACRLAGLSCHAGHEWLCGTDQKKPVSWAAEPVFSPPLCPLISTLLHQFACVLQET